MRACGGFGWASVHLTSLSLVYDRPRENQRAMTAIDRQDIIHDPISHDLIAVPLRLPIQVNTASYQQ